MKLSGSIVLLTLSLVLAKINGQFTVEQWPKLNSLNCEEARVTVHVFSGTENPTWIINQSELKKVQKLTDFILQNRINRTVLSKTTTRVMGYHGFSIDCLNEQSVFVNGLMPVETFLLQTGVNHLSTPVYKHIKQHIGEIMSGIHSTQTNGVDCNKVPIRGPDSVPTYDPNSDDGGCFVKRQTENNCYAYGNLTRFSFQLCH